MKGPGQALPAPAPGAAPVTAPAPGEVSCRRYLKCMKIVSFGAFSNRVIGPFTPHLNVVKGKNEAGKTTLNAFFSGVLFGWEEARGARNTYRPANAERAGSLFFAEETATATGTDIREFELSRVRNADGLQGKDEVLGDIDKETFCTMFALTSDELRTLRKTTDITARLLTAGSGTGSSPAQALTDLQAKIGEYTSRASGNEHSITQLTAHLAELRAALAQAADEVERFKRQDKEFAELSPQRDALFAKLQHLNTEIEGLTADRASLAKSEADLARARERHEGLLAEQRMLAGREHGTGSGAEGAEGAGGNLAGITHAKEQSLRERIEVLAEEQSRRAHSVEVAKENCRVSRANYEALLEVGDLHGLEAKVKRQRRVQVALSILLPLLFVVSGIPMFVHGREINSLSFTALGIGLLVFALFLAGAALVMLFRPSKTEGELEQRKQDARWVVLQDRKKLEACEEEAACQAEETARFLESEGLADAHGSLRRARSLLDDAREARAERSVRTQKQQALAAQLSAAEEALAGANQHHQALLSRRALAPDAPLSQIDDLIRQKTEQRTGLFEMSEKVNRRFGELKQELGHARHQTRFDELKIESQQIRTRLEESGRDLARLLLAKRMLETAVSAWESKSQPEVYRQASRLLSLMTAGAWVQVRMSEEGRLQVVDQVRTVREPLHLSLGTCQQLYLSLRIALLMTAENVGRAIPIMADDILVNFDEERRRGALAALRELSEKRQVVLFTCHEEIVRLMQEDDSQLNLVEL